MRAGVILAGGRSRRMGRDKAFVPLADKPLLLWVCDALLASVDELVLSIRKDDDPVRYEEIVPSRGRVVRDILEVESPLVGIFSALRELRSDYTVILPCDTPFVRGEILEHLFETASGADAAIPRWRHGRVEPLQAAYRVTSAVRAAEASLRAHRYSNRDMIRKLGSVVYVPVEELKTFDGELVSFFNVNSPAQLDEAKRIAVRLAL